MTSKTEQGNCPPQSALPVLSGEEEVNLFLAKIGKALGHPARVAIVRILLRKESCVCGEIVEELPLAQSTVSQHLKQLKEAGLIRGEVDGPRVCYCLESGLFSLFKELLAQL